MEKKTRINRKNKNKKSKKMTKNDIFNKFAIEFKRLCEEYLKSERTSKDTLKFEELTTQLLLKIDNIDSNGDLIIRKKRKEIINNINEKLDSLC
jgi:hypothetical protein